MKKSIALFLCIMLIFLVSCQKSDGKDNESFMQNTTMELPHTSTNATTISTESIQLEPTTVEIPTNPDDPYSIFIKDRYDDIYEAQKDSGAEYFGEFDKHSRDCYYFIYDIDGNGVEELILGDWKSITNDIEDYYAPRKIIISSVYTLENEELKKQESHPWWNDEILWERVILTNGLIRTSYGAEDNPSYSYLGLANGVLKLKYVISYTGDIDGNRFYKKIYINDKGEYIEEKITKEEFERLRDEANGDAEVVEINWKRIDEYGR